MVFKIKLLSQPQHGSISLDQLVIPFSKVLTYFLDNLVPYPQIKGLQNSLILHSKKPKKFIFESVPKFFNQSPCSLRFIFITQLTYCAKISPPLFFAGPRKSLAVQIGPFCFGFNEIGFFSPPLPWPPLRQDWGCANEQENSVMDS